MKIKTTFLCGIGLYNNLNMDLHLFYLFIFFWKQNLNIYLNTKRFSVDFVYNDNNK